MSKLLTLVMALIAIATFSGLAVAGPKGEDVIYQTTLAQSADEAEEAEMIQFAECVSAALENSAQKREDFSREAKNPNSATLEKSAQKRLDAGEAKNFNSAALEKSAQKREDYSREAKNPNSATLEKSAQKRQDYAREGTNPKSKAAIFSLWHNKKKTKKDCPQPGGQPR